MLNTIYTTRSACMWLVLCATMLSIYYTSQYTNDLSSSLKHYNEFTKKQYMFLTSPVASDIFSNYTNRSRCPSVALEAIHYFKKMIHQDGISSQNDFPNSTCEGIFQKKLRGDKKLLQMKERIMRVKEICGQPGNYLHFPVSANPHHQLADPNHHWYICRNAKAGSTTLLRYALKLNSQKDAVVFNPKIHVSIREYFPKLNETVAASDQYLKLTIVRHPFRRVLSNYFDKVVRTNWYATTRALLYSEMIHYSKLSYSDVKSMFHAYRGLNEYEFLKVFKLRSLPCPKVELAVQSDSDEMSSVPTFRGFVLGILFDVLAQCNVNSVQEINTCLTTRDVHHRLFVANCAPCDIQYDGILKMETYEEDMKFFEELLELPPVWDCLHGGNATAQHGQEKRWGNFSCWHEPSNDTTKIIFNEAKKKPSFKQYMSQLSDFEMNLLYSAYYNDFNMFGYNPCEGL